MRKRIICKRILSANGFFFIRNPAYRPTMMTIADKIRAIMNASGWKQMQIAEHFGVSQSTVNRWLAGAEPEGHRRDAINEAYDRIANDAPREYRDPVRVVPIVGKAGAGPDGSVLFATGDGNFGEVPAPEGASENTSALEVQGDSMRGLANDGWLVFYDEKESPREDHMGEPCVCFLEDDRVLIKTPWPGSQPGLFHLESFNAPLMRDIPVNAFAFITDIKPRRSAQKYVHRNPDAQISDVTISGHKRA